MSRRKSGKASAKTDTALSPGSHVLKMPAAFRALSTKSNSTNSGNEGYERNMMRSQSDSIKTLKQSISSPSLDHKSSMRSNGTSPTLVKRSSPASSNNNSNGAAVAEQAFTSESVDDATAQGGADDQGEHEQDNEDDGESSDEEVGEYHTAVDNEEAPTTTPPPPPAPVTASLPETSGTTTSDIHESRRSASLIRSSMDLQKPRKRSSSRDRYGFRKRTNFVSQEEYDKWWDTYEPHLKRRKKKWIALMKESGLYSSSSDEPPVRFPPKSEKLKRYVRKGVPAEWRGNAWFWFAKGHEQLNSHPGLYDKLCRQTLDLKNNDTELIERDLQRTFPDNIYFRPKDKDTATSGANKRKEKEDETVLIQALRRVLTCFSVYMPKIGYCQSLNFLAGLLLLFMDEEKAFWMLVIITQRYLPGVHEVNLEGVSIDQGVLVLCIKEALPSEMWDKLGVNFEGKLDANLLSNLPPITLCTTPWFMSGYIGVLPIETVLRVWDCFFFEDSKIFFRIALTILKLSEPTVQKMNDQMEIFQAIQNLPRRMIDASFLMEMCFKRKNGFGHMSQQKITRLRQFVHQRRQLYHQQQHEHRAENLNADSQSVMDATTYTETWTSQHRHRKNKTNDDNNEDTTDLEEFKKLKPALGKKRGLHLSKRMKSLRKRTSLTNDNENNHHNNTA